MNDEIYSDRQDDVRWCEWLSVIFYELDAYSAYVTTINQGGWSKKYRRMSSLLHHPLNFRFRTRTCLRKLSWRMWVFGFARMQHVSHKIRTQGTFDYLYSIEILWSHEHTCTLNFTMTTSPTFPHFTTSNRQPSDHDCSPHPFLPSRLLLSTFLAVARVFLCQIRCANCLWSSEQGPSIRQHRTISREHMSTYIIFSEY